MTDTEATGTAVTEATDAEDAIPGIGSPCDIADAAMVGQAFEALGASVDEGLEGYAKNCTYWLGIGTASKVDVFYVGTVDRWEEVKADWDAKEGAIVAFAGADEASLAKVETAALELANAIVAKNS